MKVAVIMGSNSDYTTMVETCNLLEQFEIPYDKKVVSAHRTPDLLVDYNSCSGRCGSSTRNGSFNDDIACNRSTY